MGHSIVLSCLLFTTASQADPVQLAVTDIENLERLQTEWDLSRWRSMRPHPAWNIACRHDDNLPFDDNAFDFVLSFNVVDHGHGAIVRQVIAEMERVIAPDGLYRGAQMPKENAHFGKGEEIAPNTFIDAGEGDKAHPFFYCDEAELRELFSGSKILEIKQRKHRTPGSWHWHVPAQCDLPDRTYS